MSGAVIVAACSDRTHAAATSDELQDEIRLIALVARSHVPEDEDSVCVSRRIEPGYALPTLDLDELGALQQRETESLVAQPSGETRLLDGRSIESATGIRVAGPSCTSSMFMAFARVQFLGDSALVSARASNNCAVGTYTVRAEHRDGTWTVTDRRESAPIRATACVGPARETKSGYFAVGRAS